MRVTSERDDKFAFLVGIVAVVLALAGFYWFALAVIGLGFATLALWVRRRLPQ